MMFLLADTPEFGGAAEFSPKALAQSIGDAITEAFSPKKIQTFFLTLEDNAKKTNTKISNGLKDTAKQVESAVFETYKQTLSIGGSMQDATDYLEAYADELGKLPNIQQEIVEQSVKFAKASGMATKEIAQAVGMLSKFGIGQRDAMDRLQKTFLTARKFGVDSNKLTKTLIENISKANSYGFKDGVAGLTKMAAQSQSLSVNMKDTFNLAGDLLDPDKALEFSTNMQLLGNDAGGLGDFFMNMYQAQNDVEGFQKRIEKSMTTIVSINKQTGEIGKMSGEQMRRAREMANLLGKDFDQIVQESESLTKNQFKLDKIKGGLINKGITSEEDQQLIASLAEIGAGGKVEIKIPGQSAMIDAANVTAAQLESLRGGLKSGEDVEKMSTSDVDAKMVTIANQQLSTLQDLNNTMERIEKSQIFQMTSGDILPGIRDLVIETKKIADTMGTTSPITDVITGLQTLNSTTVTLISNYVSQLPTIMTNFTDAIELLTGVISPATPTEDAFLPSGGAPVVMSEGEIFKGIVGDQVAMGTDLDKTFNITKKLMQIAKIHTESILNSKDIDEQFKISGENLKLSPESPTVGKLGEKSNKLQEIATTSNNNININGGANVSGTVEVKVSGNGINLDDPKLSSLITAKVSAMIEERLSKGWNQKQGNVVS
jgi:hypothetical protein